MPFDGRFWGQSVDVKVVIFGLAISSSWGNGHATLWRGLCSALITQGHRVVFFERDTEWYAAHRDLHHLPGGRLVLYSGWADVLPAARRELADADAGIVTSYCPDALVASALLMRSTVAVRAFYDLDTPVTLANLAAGRGYALCRHARARRLRSGPELHRWRRPRRAVPATRRAPRGAALWQCQPGRAPRGRPGPAYRCDLSYLGTFAADRQAAVEELFVAPARQLPECRFVLGGAAIPRASPGRRTSTSCGTCRPPSIPPFTARAA